MLRDTQFMRDPGKLLFRVGHPPSHESGMGRIWKDHLIAAFIPTHRIEISEYQKFCYWVDLHGLRKVRESLEGKGIQLTDEARIPCRVLRTSKDVGYLAPPAWAGFCKRRTSWYGKSDKVGKFLVVSNTSFDHLDIGNPIIIAESDFRPPRLSSLDELAPLIISQEFQSRKPPIWKKVDSLDKEFYQRWSYGSLLAITISSPSPEGW